MLARFASVIARLYGGGAGEFHDAAGLIIAICGGAMSFCTVILTIVQTPVVVLAKKVTLKVPLLCADHAPALRLPVLPVKVKLALAFILYPHWSRCVPETPTWKLGVALPNNWF